MKTQNMVFRLIKEIALLVNNLNGAQGELSYTEFNNFIRDDLLSATLVGFCIGRGWSNDDVDCVGEILANIEDCELVTIFDNFLKENDELALYYPPKL